MEALALAVPTDAATEPLPAELTTISSGALEVFDEAGSGDWAGASATVRGMEVAWETYRAGEVPRLIEPRMNLAMASLARAVRAEEGRGPQRCDPAARSRASICSCDIGPRPRSTWRAWICGAAQLLVDEAAGDADGVRADQLALDYDRDRIQDAVDARDLVRINTEIGAIQVAVVDDELAAAAAAAERLRVTLADLQPLR